jgi:uncharacterized membrane protein
MNFITKHLTKVSVLMAIFFSGLSLVMPAISLAIDCSTCSGQSNLTSQQAIECGSNCASGSSQTPADASNNIDSTIRSVINLLSVVIGVIAVIMIMLGGFRYITSGGSSERVTSAKNTIMYALIGLIIVALAQLIVRFVLNESTKAPTNNSPSACGRAVC